MKELTQLKKLTEAKAGTRAAVDAFFNKVEDEVELAYDAVVKVRTTLQSAVLTNMVKDLGHPATESKAAKDAAEAAYMAIRKLEGEFNDLHRALATNFEKIDEAVKSEELSPAQQEKIVKKVLSKVESDLPHDCRYKSWDTFPSKKEAHWVTQESNESQGEQAAKTIAKAIRAAGVKGWTVKVTIRDDYTGPDMKTWQGKAKS